MMTQENAETWWTVSKHLQKEFAILMNFWPHWDGVSWGKECSSDLPFANQLVLTYHGAVS